MKKAAVYVRVSTTKQANEGYSLEAQEKTLKKFVRDRGWNLHRVYKDAGVSGGTVRRDAFQKLLNAAERGMFDVVVVYKLDRFSRSLGDLIETLNKLGHCRRSGLCHRPIVGGIVAEFYKDITIPFIFLGVLLLLLVLPVILIKTKIPS